MLDFSITDFKLSHGFSSKNGLINGHIGSFKKKFFLCGLFRYVWYHGLFISCLGWCKCWAFIFFFLAFFVLGGELE